MCHGGRPGRFRCTGTLAGAAACSNVPWQLIKRLLPPGVVGELEALGQRTNRRVTVVEIMTLRSRACLRSCPRWRCCQPVAEIQGFKVWDLMSDVAQSAATAGDPRDSLRDPRNSGTGSDTNQGHQEAASGQNQDEWVPPTPPCPQLNPGSDSH